MTESQSKATKGSGRGFTNDDCLVCGGKGYVVVYFDDINSYGKDCIACGGTGVAA